MYILLLKMWKRKQESFPQILYFLCKAIISFFVSLVANYTFSSLFCFKIEIFILKRLKLFFALTFLNGYIFVVRPYQSSHYRAITGIHIIFCITHANNNCQCLYNNQTFSYWFFSDLKKSSQNNHPVQSLLFILSNLKQDMKEHISKQWSVEISFLTQFQHTLSLGL